jgi:uncharacterized protein
MRLHIATVLLTSLLLSAAVSAADNAEPEAITIGISSPASVDYPYGHGLAIMLTKYVGGVTVTDEPSQASAQNVLLLEQRKAMLGFVTMGVALQAWNGTGWAKGTQYRSMRALFPMYDTPFQFAAPHRLNLASLAQFAGKRIGSGPKASTAGAYFPEVFKVLDIPVVLRNGAWEEVFRQVASGEFDGMAIALGTFVPDLAALDAREPLDFIQPSP